MTTQAEHEAAAADLFAEIENADHHASNADCRAAGEDLSQACPLAEAHKIRAIVLIAADRAEAVRQERERAARVADQYAREQRAVAEQIGAAKAGSPVVVAAAVAETLAGMIRVESKS